MNVLKIKLYLLSLILILVGCTKDEESAPPPPSAPAEKVINYSNLSPECFVPYSSSPIIGAGVNDYFSGSTWGDPVVINVGTEYIMYASSGKYLNDDPGTFDWNIKIYRFTDG